MQKKKVPKKACGMYYNLPVNSENVIIKANAISPKQARQPSAN